MKRIIKKTGKIIIVFFVAIIVFNILLLCASLFPSRLIKENVIRSSEILKKEGNAYKFFDIYEVENNNYTDALVINETYSIDSSSPFESYMTAKKNYSKENTKTVLTDNLEEGTSVHTTGSYDPVGELDEFLKGNISTSVKYARYWHGYLSIYRPLLIFFDISQIRWILLFIFVILFVSLVVLLKNKLSAKVAMIFAIVLILEDYFFVSYSLESAPVFITAMLASIILLFNIDRIKDWYCFLFVVACITNFVDYLTVPLITLALPLYIYILYNSKNTLRENIVFIIKSSLIWLIGYSATWIAKWVIYDFVYQEGLIKSAISQVIFRSTVPADRDGKLLPHILGFILNKTVYLMIVLYALISIAELYYLCLYVLTNINNASKKLRLRFEKKKLMNGVAFIIIAFMPIVWYVVLSNHTLVHGFFVYRHLIIFFLGVLLYISDLFTIGIEEITSRVKE